ncbi:MAG: ADP-ribosylation factor-like protein [Candidatus Hodarchaeales archaeon]|jgi:small GTP-binding protein
MGLNVLIIDDDEDFSEGLTLLLRRKNHNPVIAHTAIEGLKIANEQNPEVILLDLLLPGMDGVIALELFRHDVPNIPILVISGLEKDNPKAQVALNSGIKGYIKKPFDPVELFERLEDIETSKQKSTSSHSNIVILGLSGAGKTSLINRFIHNSFSPSVSTLGIDLEYYYGNDGTFRLIDLAGQKHFRDFLWKENIRIADAIIFVFDLTSIESIHQEAVEWFWKSVNDWAKKDAPILFIGNKSDLPGLDVFDIYRLFKLSDLSQTKHNFQVMQTSAKTGENVSLAFGWLLERFEWSQTQKNCIDSVLLFEKSSRALVTEYKFKNGNFNITESALVNILATENVFTLPEMQHTDFYHQDKYIIILSHTNYVLTVIGDSSTSSNFIDELHRLFNYIVNSIIYFDAKEARNITLNWLLNTEFDTLLKQESINEMAEDDLFILIAEWDESSGGKLHNIFPKHADFNFKRIISTCFMTKFGIYGFAEDIRPTMLSIPIVYEKPGFDARILFDKEKNSSERIYAIITLFKNTKINIYEHNKVLVDYQSQISKIEDWNDDFLNSFFNEVKDEAFRG